MANNKTLKVATGFLSVLTLASAGLMSVHAQDTTVTTLTINGGALTMYAGDDTDNNDLCETGNVTTGNPFLNDAGVAGNINCTAAEQTSTLTSLTVSSLRQVTTSTINDILFEDLSGSENNTYAVSAVIGNLVNQGDGLDITLGSNPDSLTTDSETDAPGATNGPGGSDISADNGKIYATLNPSAGTNAAIAPESAKAPGNTANLTKGAKTTVIDNTSISVFNTNSVDVVPGRYDLDGCTFKFRIPAFADADSYRGSIVFTVVAS